MTLTFLIWIHVLCYIQKYDNVGLSEEEVKQMTADQTLKSGQLPALKVGSGGAAVTYEMP